MSGQGDADNRGPIRVHSRRQFVVDGTFTVDESTSPWDVVESVYERSLSRLYELNDGDYRISIVVLPVDNEGEAHKPAS